MYETTDLIFYVNQTNISDIYHQTTIHSYDTFADENNATYIFYLTNFSNQEYIVSIQFSHETFGESKYDYGIGFGNAIEVIGDVFSPFILGMFGVFLLIFVALIFGSRNAEMGGLITTVFAGIFKRVGSYISETEPHYR